MIVKFMFIPLEVVVSLAHSSRIATLLVIGGVAVAGCTGGNDDDPGELDVPDTYAFESRFTPGTSSVSYTGQVLRQVLITDMKTYIGGLTGRIDAATFTPAPGDVRLDLDYYYAFDAASSGADPVKLLVGTSMQATYGAIGSANLKTKIAGNDPGPQHKDWTVPGNFIGMTVGTANVATPDAQVLAWFDQLDRLAVDRANGIRPLDPMGAPVTKVFVTGSGQDLQQLTQKFLDGAVSFSQGTDDYLDDGLSVDNVLPGGDAADKPYTALEHHWDEGFGYFGAARDYGLRTDDEINAVPYFDTNGDGMIDLLSEYSFGHSVNAAKRDRGSNAAARTDFSGAAMTAFLTGRAIITHADGVLTPDEVEDLNEQRDIAVANWELAIGSTLVHYINQTLQNTAAIGTGTYNYYDHAKEWSEMKGFSLALQFNPRSPLTDAQFAQIQAAFGDKPALTAGEAAAYATALRDARSILATAYGFAPENVGDADGLGGW